jgi:hypothetical protein
LLAGTQVVVVTVESL